MNKIKNYKKVNIIKYILKISYKIKDKIHITYVEMS